VQLDNLTFDGDYAAIPAYMQEPLLAYVRTGRLTSDFLRAVMSNNLFDAVDRADSANLPLIPLYVRWLYNRAPLGCYGWPELVAEWSRNGGLAGQPD
jgi:hypothetical protein